MTPDDRVKMVQDAIARIGRSAPGDNARVQDKIRWLNIVDLSDVKIRCTDKLLAKEYVLEKASGLVKCAKTLAVLDGPDAVMSLDVGSLPRSFLIKFNSGCGTNIFVRDKGLFNAKNAYESVKTWFRGVPGLNSEEYQYSLVEPKAFVEECLIRNEWKSLIDYRIWVFNNECRYISVNAGFGHGAIQYFDTDFNPLWFSNGAIPPDDNDVFRKPECLRQMLHAAELLSEPFKFVRVDLYVVQGVPYFGEFTFSPGGYGFRLVDKSGASVDEEVGEWLNI